MDARLNITMDVTFRSNPGRPVFAGAINGGGAIEVMGYCKQRVNWQGRARYPPATRSHAAVPARPLVTETWLPNDTIELNATKTPSPNNSCQLRHHAHKTKSCLPTSVTTSATSPRPEPHPTLARYKTVLSAAVIGRSTIEPGHQLLSAGDWQQHGIGESAGSTTVELAVDRGVGAGAGDVLG